ncbi:MAG: cytochrome c oxidase subunit [Sphingomonadales bacterium]|nr:cytochrome c oxidase subunit [Sphingomonadales bacterium]
MVASGAMTIDLKPRSSAIPGEAGLWVIIVGDLLIFSLFFVSFAWHRIAEPTVFAASQAQMVQMFGLGNTLLLLTSSLFVVWAIQAARHGRAMAAKHLTTAAMLLGAGFVVMKYFEYSEKIRHGFLPSTNDFYMLYFTFTAIHLLHVCVGLGALAFIRARVKQPLTPGGTIAIESCAIFWHLVDILWMILFAIFYLHR